ncbi:MAG: hypothetical protein ABEH78_09740 [Haloferacaceae archaeon]
MELRCLLGHEFGEREVERERREEGDEVVVVYRTVENCRRCGERRVVSENKEVRALGALAGSESNDAAADERAPAAGVGGATDDRPDGTPDGNETDGGDDAGPPGETATDGASDGEGTEPAPAGGLVEAAEAVGTPGDDGPDTDDAVIIGGADGGNDGGGSETTDEPGAGPANGGADAETGPANGGADAGMEAEPAAKPERTAGTADEVAPEGGVELLGDAGDAGDASDDGSTPVDEDGAGRDAEGADDTAGGWPTPSPDAADEGYDAAPHDDTGTDVDFGGGFAPTVEDGGGGAAATGGVEPGFVRADDGAEAGGRDADGPTELHCPNCGSTRTAAESSLRGGDICPDCRKGYVAERAAEE